MSANDIKQRLDAYKKKRDEAQAPSAPQQNTASANTPSAGSSASSNTQSLSNRLAEYKQKRNELNAPSAFTMFGNRYIKTANGNYNKFVDTRKSEEDKASTLKTGHDTLFTDLQQALFSGMQNWGSGHIQSATTLGLLGGAILTGDENYTPNAGHGLENMLWKMSQVSSANSRANAEMLENAQEGRKWLGRTAMEVVSTMTTNGIDSLIRTLPGGDFLGKLSFASRSFGAASQEAREQGMTIPSQVLKGTISAAIETVTEGMWEYGGTRDFAGEPIKGTGPLGKATEAIENFLTSKLGPIVSPMIMAFGTEAVEEMMADVLNPLAGTIVENTLGKTNLFDDFEGDKWQGIRNMLHDGLIGGLSGIFGGAYEGMMNDAVIKQIYGGNISEWQLARRNEREMQIALTQDKALREMLTKFATKDGRKKLSPFVKKKVRDAFSAEKGRKIGRAIANDFFAAFEELTDEECANPELAMTSLVKRYYDKAASRYGIDLNATAEIDDDGDLTPWFIREGETKEEALKRFQEWLDEEDIEEPAEETLEDAEAKEIFEDGITGIQGENEGRSRTDLGVESQRPNDTVEVAESQTNELRRESESSFEQA